jgi:hypothetical protein
MRSALGIGTVLTALALAAPMAARASTVRYALLVGNNQGLADDSPLRFAQADAERLSRALVQLGGFPEENTTVLRDRTAPAVRSALLTINERVRQSVSGGRNRAVLFVFYSGHSDAQDLHLSGTTMPVEELRKMVVGSSATVRVLVVDACRSGSATRTKGGRPGPGFAIKLDDRLDNEGVAIITSSAATEDSQESDTLQGSFFTHFLLSGLRGAADANSDRRVSLAEAYAYAYNNTLRMTSLTIAGPQHPTYEYGIRGKGDLIITELYRIAGHGSLRFGSDGHFLIMQGDSSGPVVAEVVTGRSPSELLLPAGKYFVRKRRPDLLLEGKVVVTAGVAQNLREEQMQRVSYAQLVRKGGGKRSLSQGPMLAYVLHGPIAAGLGPLSGVEVSYPLAFSFLTVSPRLGYGLTSGSNAHLSLAHHEVSASLAAYRVFDVSRFSLFVGLVTGWALAHQSFTAAVSAPDRNSNMFLFGADVGVETHLWRGVYLHVRGGPRAYVFRALQTDGSDRMATQATYQVAAGLGWQIR